METTGQDCSTSTVSADQTCTQKEDGAELQATVSTKKRKRASRNVQWNEDSFQKEIHKWEEFYDDMKAYLVDGRLPRRNQSSILKQAQAFFLGSNSRLYYTKTLKDGAVTLKLPVVRSYEERMRVCNTIHLSTGEECIHHRRDTMLELLGQQYYWKGQRRDVCQCIASCAMCSLGLGAKRRAKPPGQKRDIRPSQKFLRVGTALIPFTRVSAPLTLPTSPPSPSSQARRGSRERSLSSIPLTSGTVTTPTSHSHTLTDSTAGTHHSSNHSHTGNDLTTNDDRVSCTTEGGDTSTLIDPLTNLYTIADACSSTAAKSDFPFSSRKQLQFHSSKIHPEIGVGSEVTVSNRSGLQIFQTIDEPYEPVSHTTSDHPLSVHDDNSDMASGSSGDEQCIMQGSSAGGTVEVAPSEPSIYQLLFRLPSVPNTSLSSEVIEAMQMSLKSTTDPVQLAQVASESLVSVLNLSISISAAVVSPSRAAAYVTSLAVILMKQGLLSTDPPITQMSSTPPVILHDTCCEAGSPKVCSSLIGACNWNVGTHTIPMDTQMLQMAVASNRVTAVLYRPFVYPRNSSFLTLDSLTSICHTQNSDVAVIVDCSNMTGNSMAELTVTLQGMIMKGADLIMLPNTEKFRGPPHTCVLVGKAALLDNCWQQLPRLQSQLMLPLLCPDSDTVGSVVALHVSSFKTEPLNMDL